MKIWDAPQTYSCRDVALLRHISYEGYNNCSGSVSLPAIRKRAFRPALQQVIKINVVKYCYVSTFD